MKKILSIALLSIAPVVYGADSSKFEADVSYVVNQTEESTNTTLAGRLTGARTIGVWTQEYLAEASGSNSDVENYPATERYFGSAKVASEIQPGTSIFGKVQAEKDRSIHQDYNAAVTVGLSQILIKDEIQSLTGEVGIGNRFYKFEDMPSEDGVIGTIGGVYVRKLTDSVTFNQDLSYEYGSDLQTLRSRTAFSAALSEHLSGLVSYQLTNNRRDGAGSDNNQLTTFGLKFSY